MMPPWRTPHGGGSQAERSQMPRGGASSRRGALGEHLAPQQRGSSELVAQPRARRAARGQRRRLGIVAIGGIISE
jgi:hypothetical protein